MLNIFFTKLIYTTSYIRKLIQLLNNILYKKLFITLPLYFTPLPRKINSTKAIIVLKKEP